MTTAISIGPATTLVADQVYALPAKLIFITSTVSLESSINGTDWLTVADVETTGALLNSVFIRSVGSEAIVVCRAASAQFNVDSIPTEALLQVAGLGINTPAVADKISFVNAAAIEADVDFTIHTIGGNITIDTSDSGGDITLDALGTFGTLILKAKDAIALTVDASFWSFNADGSLFIPGTIAAPSGILTLQTIGFLGWYLDSNGSLNPSVGTEKIIGPTIVSPIFEGSFSFPVPNPLIIESADELSNFTITVLDSINGVTLSNSGAGDITIGGATNLSVRIYAENTEVVQFNSGGISTTLLVAATGFSADGEAGINTTITTGNLVGKTITVTKGLITGFA